MSQKRQVVRWQDRLTFIPLFKRLITQRIVKNWEMSDADVEKLTAAIADWLEEYARRGCEISFRLSFQAPRTIEFSIDERQAARKGFEAEIAGWKMLGKSSVELD
jgi:hypothetical protein